MPVFALSPLNRLRYWGFLVSLLASLSHASPQNADQPIRVITNDWSSQIVLAHIAGGIFEALGYEVEYSSSATSEQWGALALGIDHVQVEVWEGTMSDMFTRMVKVGRIVDAGSHNAITREEWWYPKYVEDVCPGLPDWRALNRCSALFRDESSGSKGRYLTGPWEKPEAARIRALGLNFEVQRVSDANQLWSALKQASDSKAPIVLFNWTPNWVEARYQGSFVEFPQHAPDCESDPAWGINPLYHYDCGNPSRGWLKKAAWSGMVERWPCAYQTLQNINFDNLTIARLAARVDVDRVEYREVANEWLLANQALWHRWKGESCSQELQTMLTVDEPAE